MLGGSLSSLQGEGVSRWPHGSRPPAEAPGTWVSTFVSCDLWNKLPHTRLPWMLEKVRSSFALPPSPAPPPCLITRGTRQDLTCYFLLIKACALRNCMLMCGFVVGGDANDSCLVAVTPKPADLFPRRAVITCGSLRRRLNVSLASRWSSLPSTAPGTSLAVLLAPRLI